MDRAQDDSPRAVGVLFKMSKADREDLKRRAAAAGCETVQQYLERVALGRDVPPRPAGRPRGTSRRSAHIQEALLPAS